MKKIIRLTESDLTRIVRRVIKESKWERERTQEDPHSGYFDSKSMYNKFNPSTEFDREVLHYMDALDSVVDSMSTDDDNNFMKVHLDNILLDAEKDLSDEQYNEVLNHYDSIISDLNIDPDFEGFSEYDN